MSPDPMDSLEELGPIVDVPTAATYLNLDGTEPQDWLLSAVLSANASVLDFLSWDPRSMETTEIVDSTGGPIIVSRKKITGITSVSLMIPGCSQPVPQNLAYFQADQRSAIIYCNGVLPRGEQMIQVVYTAGYVKLPPALVLAIKMTVKAMFDATGVDLNSTGENINGVLSRQFWPTGPGNIPPAARSMLTQYQRDI